MKQICIVLLFACTAVSAQDTVSYNLQQCIDLAIRNNFTYYSAELQKERGRAKLQQGEATLLPSVSAYANQGISTGKSINPYTNTFINQEVATGQYGLNASLTLFSGFSNINNLLQSRYSYKADQADLEQATIDLKLQVCLAYYAVLNNHEQWLQAGTQAKVTKSQLDRITTLNDNQAISPSVLYDTKGQMASDKVYISNCLTAYRNAIINLSAVINYNFTGAVKFEDVNPSETPALLNPETADNGKPAPMVRSANLRRESAFKSFRMSEGLLFPTLSLNGSLGSNYSSAALSQRLSGFQEVQTGAYVMLNNNPVPVYEGQSFYASEKVAFNTQLRNNLNTYIGFSLQVPIFNALRNKTQMQLAKINYKQSDRQYSTTQNKFQQLIQQTRNEVLNAYERWTIYQEQVNDYTRSFEIASVKFEKGAITTYDYLISKNNLDRSKINLINARYDYLYKTEVLRLYNRL